MANKQTRAYRKANLSTFVVKGAQVPKAKADGLPMGTCLGVSEISLVKQPSKRGKAWKGHGNPLGRNV